jgi:hypothetical protein
MEVEAVKVLSQVYTPEQLNSKSPSNSAMGSSGPSSRKMSLELGTVQEPHPTTPIPQLPGGGHRSTRPGIAHLPPPASLSLVDATFSPPIRAVDLSSSSSAGASAPLRVGVDYVSTTPPPQPRLPATLDNPLPVATLELLQDRLGKLVLASAAALGSCSFLELCISHRGPGCLTGASIIPHPAIPILQQLRDEGAYVHRSAPDWTLEQRDAAVRRGAHQSTEANRAFVREEFADMVEAGQWLVAIA